MCQERHFNSIRILLLMGVFLPSFTQNLDYGLVIMENSCGSTVTLTTSFQMDSSPGITYNNQLSCSITITAPSNHFTVAHITRFELESSLLTGTCTDYLDTYDGTSNADPKLNSNLICGDGTSVPENFTSTGQSMTLHFVTDSSGIYSGFNILFVAAKNAPCSSGYFTCNTDICIDSTLECDGYDQCGDNSDEADCAEEIASSGIDLVMIIAISVSVVLVIGGVVAFIAYRIYDRNRWKKFINGRMDDDDDGIVEPGPSYPITHKYYKGVRGHPAYYTSATDVTDGEKDGSTDDTVHNFEEGLPSPVTPVSPIST